MFYLFTVFLLLFSKISCKNLKLILLFQTGTLTEEGLDLMGVRPAVKDGGEYVFFSCFSTNNNHTRFGDMFKEPSRGPLGTIMMTTHSLTHVGHEIMGDPLETKIFFATGAVCYILYDPCCC